MFWNLHLLRLISLTLLRNSHLWLVSAKEVKRKLKMQPLIKLWQFLKQNTGITFLYEIDKNVIKCTLDMHNLDTSILLLVTLQLHCHIA